MPTTVDNQAIGFMAALAQAGADPATLQAVVHGTTTTTNALLERKIAKVGLITTKGFRDVLELGRRTRPQPYGLRGTFEPLIDRELRLEVPERMDADGKVLTPLDEAAVAEAAKTLLALGCEAVVIHFLHSYINPDARAARRRDRARPVAQRLCHGGPCHPVGVPRVRARRDGGGERLGPAGARPLSRRGCAPSCSAKGFDRDLLVMQGNGGTISSQLIAEAAVNTVMSGPASGVMAAAYTGRASGHPNLITYDMGGTSTDVGLIENAVPQVSGELELEYAMPIHVPMVDVHTIGAGGGSIASVDAAGMLRVGPESAGARPGPICYGRGGTEPTITDANLVLGRLNPDRLLGVDHPVTLDHVRAIIAEKIGKPLGLDAEAAAAAILRIANDRMAGAIRLVSLSRGHDPRDFALFAFGGAGPLHATALARELAHPDGAGAGAARHHQRAGLRRRRPAPRLCAHRQQAAVGASTMPRSRASTPSRRPRARRRSAREGVPVRELRRVYTADMQFQGQSHILSVGVDRARHRRRRPAQGLRRRLLAPLRHRARGNPAGARQPAHRGDRRAAGDFAGRARRDRARADLGGRAGRRTPRLVHRRLAPDAGLCPREAAARRRVRRPGDPRAARLHDRRRTGRQGPAGHARQSVDLGEPSGHDPDLDRVGISMAFRFVHAADIHLDSPLRSLALRNPELADLIGNATRQVFTGIIDLCLAEEVDALFLAGDLYDGDQTSMKTARYFANQLHRLDQAGIRVFIVRGNHDALSRITKELILPESVKLFSGRAEAIPIEGAAGMPRVVIHGMSFAQPHAPDSLMPRTSRRSRGR